MRSIDDILYFRSDISPFLVHLTRKSQQVAAKCVLTKIITDRELIAGKALVSDARLGINNWSSQDLKKISNEDKKRFFGAVCFTETPLNEVHCLLEVDKRHNNFEPYGLVFLKDEMSKKGVSPVIYLNNEQDNQFKVLEALCSLIKSYPDEAANLLPLIGVFGERIYYSGRVDFSWEREWRYPAGNKPLNFTENEIFIGLCPHEEIEYFESIFDDRISFIDPRRNMKWYATKLIKSRQKLQMKNSVV